jgi:hypothetical protein
VLKLDLNHDANNDDANTQLGFTKFVRADSGSEVNGVVIDLEGELQSARREDPCGAREMYDKFFGSVVPDPCWYSPRAGERIYRDFIYSRSSIEEDVGVKITLYGLGVNRDCNITLWGYDTGSAGDTNRVANWYANGTHILDTNFIGGTASYPLYDNFSSPTVEGWQDLYKYGWSGKATSDALGRIILTSQRDPNGAEGQPFSFVNAIRVEPNNISQTFTPTKYAHRPVPFDETEDVPVNTVLKWRKGDGAVKHDLYLGTNFNDVNTATRASHPNVAVYAPDLDSNTYDPYTKAGFFLGVDTTCYWRVDENDNPPLYPGLEVWSFTTSPNSVVDIFDEYKSMLAADMRKVWNDFSYNGTGMDIFPEWDPNHGIPGPNNWSMRCEYKNDLDPYYSEVDAAVDTLRPNGLGIDKNWLGMGAKSLVLWFYGCGGGTVIKPLPYNDPNEQMYVKLTDGDDVSGRVNYPYMSEVTEEEWHEWNIDLAFFDACGVDLSNVKKITIGFDGDGTGENVSIEPNIVYFDDIQLYATRCALVERSEYFTKLDYAPGGALAGDCVIDYQEIDEMGNAWLNGDLVVATKNPGDTNLVVYFPLNEGDGNKVYSRPDLDAPDVCDARITGTFWNSGVNPPSNRGTSWATEGAPGIGGGSSVYFDGSEGTRINCGVTYGDFDIGIGVHPEVGEVNAITLSVWVKWLGPRYWDGYLLSKGSGILGKRDGWSDDTVVWTLWTCGCPDGRWGIGNYPTAHPDRPDVGSGNGSLNPFIGKWVHLAVTYPNPPTATDANAQAILYLNGGPIQSGPYTFAHGYDANIWLTIGCTMDQNHWVDSPESFYGNIDEVRIYNRVLEPNEIGYLADVDPEDGELWVPISSLSNVYDANEIPPYVGEQPKGKRVVNFKDFAVVFNRWLTEEMFPPSHR